MTELAPGLQRALARVDTNMDVDRTDLVWKGLGAKRRRRVVRRTAGAAAMLLLVGGIVFYRGSTDNPAGTNAQVTPTTPTTQQPVGPTTSDDGAIRLADGSTIVPEDKATKIDVVTDVATAIAIVVNQGKGRFSVTRRASRTFKVTTTEVRIAVYAAEFSVARFDSKTGYQTRVYVERGYVDITYGSAGNVTRRRIDSGETVVFPLTEATTATVEPLPTHSTEPPKTAAKQPKPAVVHTRTQRRRLAVSDLLKKADAARSAQRPGDAIKPLTRVVREFSRDPRAAMASFTLGRLYLKQLNRPRSAALAFRRVQVLAPVGPLVEDALAREVESWAAAGQADNAKTRAAVYLKRHPNGHRARAMKKYAE